MNNTNYTFYAAKLSSLVPGYGYTISDIGEMVEESGYYTYGVLPLAENNGLYVDLPSNNAYNKVFFYDEDMTLLETISLPENTKIIVPTTPTITKFWAVRFTYEDEGAYANRYNQFIYYTTSINPVYKDLTKKYAKENSQVFFRTSLEGKFTLTGLDYNLICSANLEDQFLFLINDALHNLYFKGSFGKSDCKFDYAKRLCEPKVSSIDKYSNIINNYKNSYDLIKLSPAITKITAYKRLISQVYIGGASVVTNFSGGTYWETDTTEIINNNSILTGTYHFSFVRTGNEFILSGIPTGHIYAKANGIYAGTNGIFYNQDNTFKLVAIITLAGNINSWGYTYSYDTVELNLYHIVSNTLVGTVFGLPYLGGADLTFFKFNNIGSPGPWVIHPLQGLYNAVISANIDYEYYARAICDVDNFTFNNISYNTEDIAVDDFAYSPINYKKCIGLQGGQFYCSSMVTDESTKFGIRDEGLYFTDQFIPGTYGEVRPLPLARSTWGNASLWFSYNTLLYDFELSIKKAYIIKDCYLISDVIEALLNKVDPTIKHDGTIDYSQFLYSSVNPLDTNNTNRFYVCLTPKSNVLKGAYDIPAKKAEVSLEEVLNMLRDCFRCYWFIEDNKLKIEHISFFNNCWSYGAEPGIQLDLTQIKDQFNKKNILYFQDSVEYNKSELSGRYEFEWMDKTTDLFSGLYIDINSNYVQKDKKEAITTSKFTSDIDYMLSTPNDISSDGFALLCPILNNGIYELPICESSLKDEHDKSYKVVAQNWYASWAYLINYYMYDMPAWNMTCNALGDLIAENVKAILVHNIEVPILEDLNIKELITTTFGAGRIDEYSANLNNKLANIKLLYAPKR